MNEMINGATVLLTSLTINSNNSNYYNVSQCFFILLSSINHIFPENLDGLTHFVKLLFSNILFSLIEVNPYIGFTLSLIDLVPLLSKSKKVKYFGELFIQVPRQIIEFYLIYKILLDGHIISCILILIFKVIYYFERKYRIKNSNRNNFSAIHSAEHVGLYILFSILTNTYFEFWKALYIFLIWVLCVIITLFLFNRIIEYFSVQRFPEWVKENDSLVKLYKKKLKKNQQSLHLHNYICKPWLYHLKIEFISWKHLESICEFILPQINRDEIDIVVGITTGGAFVGAYLSKLLNKPFAIVESKFWSDSTFKDNCYKAYCHFSGINCDPTITSIPNVKNQRVLLADDTTYSGITMRNVIRELKKNGALDVKTFCLWIRGTFKIDYFYTRKGVPIIWEWGVELD